MGSELYRSDPHFKAAFDRLCAELDPHLKTPLQEVLFAKGKAAGARLDDTTYAQPALFALELALYEALAKRGLSPDILAGHSVGEIAAAHISGVFDLPDAAKLICARGALMGALPRGGAMAAIEATEVEVEGSLEGKEKELAIAALNGPSSTVISGAEEALEEIRAQWEEKGRKTKRLAVSHAFHSPLIEPMLAEFSEVAGSLALKEPSIPIVSNLSGELLSAEQATDPAYWVAQARGTVRFADLTRTLAAQGSAAYLELGPDPVLLAAARESLGEAAEAAAFIPTLRQSRPEADAITRAIGHAHAAGAKVKWGAFFEGTGAKRVPLPTYPFQRRHFWLAPAAAGGDASSIGQASAHHPLLGAAIALPEGEGALFTARLSRHEQPWLAAHAVADIALLPASAFLELALRAAQEIGAKSLAELHLQAPLIVSEHSPLQLRVALGAADEDGSRALAIHSRPAGEGEEGLGSDAQWTRHATATLSAAPLTEPQPLASWPPEGATETDPGELEELLEGAGLPYGSRHQGASAAWRAGDRAYAEITLHGAEHPSLRLALSAEGSAPMTWKAARSFAPPRSIAATSSWISCARPPRAAPCTRSPGHSCPSPARRRSRPPRRRPRSRRSPQAMQSSRPPPSRTPSGCSSCSRAGRARRTRKRVAW
jgi:acyl transferase domain-containing protein